MVYELLNFLSSYTRYNFYIFEPKVKQLLPQAKFSYFHNHQKRIQEELKSLYV